MLNAHNSSIAKKYSFYNFLNKSNFAFVFFSKKKFISKNVCHVYVYAMAVTCTEHLMCSHIC